MLVAEARQAVKEESPLDRVRSLMTDLQQIFHGLGVTQAQPPPPSSDGGRADDDDVIDADFTVS
jgi:molecular chaperone DnaK